MKFTEAQLEKAFAEEFIALTHPENPKHRSQKYLTTAKGKEILKQEAL